jgi:hypothetical protein
MLVRRGRGRKDSEVLVTPLALNLYRPQQGRDGSGNSNGVHCSELILMIENLWQFEEWALT